MTTIAWDGKTLAADTLITSNGMRVGHARKIGKRGRVLFAASGCLEFAQPFLAWCGNGFPGPPPPMKQDDNEAAGLVIFEDRIITFSHTGADTIRAPFYAQGSGSPMALGALHAGASAEDAIKADIALDTASGGEIMTLTLE